MKFTFDLSRPIFFSAAVEKEFLLSMNLAQKVEKRTIYLYIAGYNHYD